MLVGYTSAAADGLHVAQAAAGCTERIKFLIAHRPGFVQPTLAARKFANARFLHRRARLGAYHLGRARCRGSAATATGPTTTRATGAPMNTSRSCGARSAAARRSISQASSTASRGPGSDIWPLQEGGIPIYFGGASDIAFETGVKHCDVYMMWGEPRASIARTISRVHELAARYGRRPRLSVSFRPIIAASEDAAWEKAERYLAKVSALAKQPLDFRPQSRGSQRLLEWAAQGDIHDERLWMPIAAATGAAGNTSALVGTPDQVAEALLAYYDLGVSTILIRGFDPLPDAVEYGRELIPAVRAEAAKRDAAAARAQQPAAAR